MKASVKWDVQLAKVSDTKEQLAGTIELDISEVFSLKPGQSLASAVLEHEDQLARDLHNLLATETVPQIVAKCSGATCFTQEGTLETEAHTDYSNDAKVKASEGSNWGEIGVNLNVQVTMTTASNRGVAFGESIWNSRGALASSLVDQVIHVVRMHFHGGPLTCRSKTESIVDDIGTRDLSRACKFQRPRPGEKQ